MLAALWRPQPATPELGGGGLMTAWKGFYLWEVPGVPAGLSQAAGTAQGGEWAVLA